MSRRTRPSSIIQTNDAPSPRIVANANAIKKESIDCGITAFGCCNTAKCRQLGTTKLFFTFLLFVVIIQGAAERYLFVSIKQAALEYNYNPIIINWLLVSSGIAQGLFAILIGYCGNRIHRISWLGGLLILQSIVSLAVIIPILSHNEETIETISALSLNLLCTERTSENLTDERPHTITTLVLLFVLQVGIGLGNVGVYSLGLSYIDDNVMEHYSPAFIGAIIGAKFWGGQWGSALFYVIAESPFGWWLGWTVLGPILFIFAFLIALFPKRLLSTVVRLAADNIVEEATSNSQHSITPFKLLADIAFVSSMKRMLTNKILWFNILAACLVEVVIFNYFYFEESYLQARFFLPADSIGGVRNEWTSKILSAMLKPPLIALIILVSGLIIAKANPSSRQLAIWNVIAASFVTILFIAFIFIRCSHTQLAGAYNDKLTTPYCSRTCICNENMRFMPVCPEESEKTFYSPCHAGCSEQISTNGQTIYTNCTCGSHPEVPMIDKIATEGACGHIDCQKMWILHQALTTLAVAFVGSAIVGKILITIRSVLPQDKSLALAMELTLAGLIAYIPGKLSYHAIADSNCKFWSIDSRVCYLHDDPSFGNILNITSACLMGIAAILFLIVFIFVKDLTIYGDEPENEYHPIPLQEFNVTRYDSPAPQSPNIPEITQHEAFVPTTQTNMLNRSISPNIDSPDFRSGSSQQEDRYTPSSMEVPELSDTENLDFRSQTEDQKRNERRDLSASAGYLESEVL